MTDLNKIAENYIAAWNETDAGRRKARLDAAFTSSVSYRDPIMQGDGHDVVAALIDGVQHRFMGVIEDGRLSKVTGFLDKVPAQ